MTHYEEHQRDSIHDLTERCRTHGYVISNGTFDAPCPACEAAMEDDAEAPVMPVDAVLAGTFVVTFRHGTQITFHVRGEWVMVETLAGTVRHARPVAREIYLTALKSGATRTR